MTLDGTYTATLDRIVSGLAVLLIEEDGETVAQREVDADRLPEGVSGGAVLDVTLDDGEVVAIEARPDETEKRRETARERFERLAERPPSKGDPEGSSGRG